MAKKKRARKANTNLATLPRNKWVTARVRVTSGGKVQARVSRTVLKRKRKNPKRRKNLFGIGKKAKARRGKGYIVVDSDNYPVHTGSNLTKTEALKIAKAARADGEKVHLERYES